MLNPINLAKTLNKSLIGVEDLNSFNSILNDSTTDNDKDITESILYKTIYSTYYNTNNKTEEPITYSEDEDPEIIKKTEEILEDKRNYRKKQLINDSNKFALEFCKGLLQNNCMENIAKVITQYILDMEININHSPTLLLSPSGKVEGVIKINNSDINKK